MVIYMQLVCCGFIISLHFFQKPMRHVKARGTQFLSKVILFFTILKEIWQPVSIGFNVYSRLKGKISHFIPQMYTSNTL